MVCVVHTEAGDFGRLMQKAHRLMEVSLENNTFAPPKEDEAISLLKKGCLAKGLNLDLAVGTPWQKPGGKRFEVVGIGSNKQNRKNAIKLALAIAAACATEQEDFERHACKCQLPCSDLFMQVLERMRLRRACPYEERSARAALDAACSACSGSTAGPRNGGESVSSRCSDPDRKKRSPAGSGGSLGGATPPEPEDEFVKEIKRCQGHLVKKWRAEGKPRKRRSPIPAPMRGAKEAFLRNIKSWLRARGEAGNLQQVPDPVFEEETEPCGGPWVAFKPIGPGLVTPKDNWRLAFHGTWFYGLWLILAGGVLLESNDEDAGHEFGTPGVYVSPLLLTARWYARAHQVFGDGFYHRVVLEVRYDAGRVRKQREKGGVQLVLPSSAVSIERVLFQYNAPPRTGEERMDSWDPELEAVPPEKARPAPTIADAPPPADSEGVLVWQEAEAPPPSRVNSEGVGRVVRHALGTPRGHEAPRRDLQSDEAS